MEQQHSNALINETSPYLLQHAYNPVNWMPWGDAAFEQAKTENKLVVVSIGYSACHWCHVMEHESFEDSSAAELMNTHYISVKVDREERPDVDQIYMTAVQLMTGSGGWPLNVVCLPDGRPVWGGTYFPKKNWMQALKGIWEMYQEEPEKVLEYAEKLTQGVSQAELVTANPEPPNFSKTDTETLFGNWQKNFDTQEGGPNRAPKFPLPNNYQFLLQWAALSGNEEALEHTILTLNKMAFGGIYDQVGGGFARYSTDEIWKAPHFEKMLYDNAQLLSLYSEAYQQTKNPLYGQIVAQTYQWLKREMSGPKGEFYSALDADSEGEEGKFYVWTEAKLQAVIPAQDWEAFSSYYDLKKGRWEHGNIILMRSEKPLKSAEWTTDTWESKAMEWNNLLLKKRSERIRPGLDDKALTSWNAQMIIGLLDAATLPKNIFSESEKSQERAIGCAQWILKNQLKNDGSLYHTYKAGHSSIDGLLEDYAHSIAAFVKLYEATGEISYLTHAKKWTVYVKANFQDVATSLFFMRNLNSKQLIAKSLEITDNVIPAANSVMAKNLFLLAKYLDEPAYEHQALDMLNQVNKERFLAYGDNYSNWAQLHNWFTYPFYEVAISGKEAEQIYGRFKKNYLPNIVWVYAEKETESPLLQNRFVQGETYIYVCQNKVCQLPVQKLDEALTLIKF